ncbi:serine/threonine transporter SstT [Campylobacter sp. faydin G-140]|uniref:serine/threonine transporter SstT n=1 Tax=Campylobacter anatolicus TaxID=2829105 RepID=UPI001B9EF21F|nr:serine/threonine transporter SstT [Campylobacter anatolicus]MBR8464794.1 serine/threonine transporter SstT [Campylobacter anatolicus]
MSAFSSIAKRYADGNLIVQILIGIVLGIVVGFWGHSSVVFDGAKNVVEGQFINNMINSIAILGDLFVGALKAVAPILVFVLIATSIITKEFGSAKGMQKIVILYLFATFLASAVGVIFSFIFPVEIVLKDLEQVSMSAPQNVFAVLKDLVFKMVQNPISALSSGNYIGIITWAVAGGIAMRCCPKETKNVFKDISDGVTKIIRFIIRLAPFGIFGIVTINIYTTGFEALMGYAKLVVILVAAMLTVAFVAYPLIAFLVTKKNPYPLVMACLKESAITAFFTRSSAANIPVNMALCKKLGLKEELYSISIPLGATINMGGAAVVISIMALTAVNSLEYITVDFADALLLSFVAALGACGASGVPGGSLLLIPLACALFGINNDIAMQVVSVGFIIGVIQDSVETAINSSSDVLFTAVVSETME